MHQRRSICSFIPDLERALWRMVSISCWIQCKYCDICLFTVTRPRRYQTRIRFGISINNGRSKNLGWPELVVWREIASKWQRSSDSPSQHKPLQRQSEE